MKTTVSLWKLPSCITVSEPLTGVKTPALMSVKLDTAIVIIPLFFKPITVINKPIPTVIACFKLSGTAVISI
ncbi:hypothetical protein D3C78_1584360 [compost metagenome]